MKKLYEEESIRAIGEAIRSKNGAETKYKPADMARAIRDISASVSIQGDKPVIDAEEVPWVRPAEWPVLDNLPFPEGETTIYLTIDNTNPAAVNVVRFYKLGSGLGYVDYGHVENDQFVVDSTDSGSGTYTFPNHIFTADDPAYPVVRLRGGTTATMFRESSTTAITAAQSPNGRAIGTLNSDMFNVLEVVGNVPTITSLAASNNNPAYGGRFCRRIVLNNCDKVTNMAYAFHNNTICDEIQVNANGRMALTASNASAFSNCHTVRQLDLSKIDVSNATNLSSCFYFCRSLRRLKLDGWNVTSKCTNLSSMFRDCYLLDFENIDISDWDVSSVTSLDNTFSHCHKLKTIDLSKWQLTKCTTLNGLFAYCYVIEEVKFPQCPAPLVTSISGIFQSDTNLKKVDLAAMELRALNTTYNTFSGCIHLEYVNLGRAKVVTNSTSSSSGVGSMFSSCFSLKWIDWDMSDCDLSVSGTVNMYSNCYSLQTPLDWTFFKKSSNLTAFTLGSNCYKVPSVKFADDVYMPMLNSMVSAFSAWHSIKSINMSGFRTDAKITNIGSAFANCWNAEEIILPEFDASQVTSASNMFQQCNKLKNIPETVKSLNMPKCTTLGTMLSDCYSLEQLDFSQFKCAPTTISYLLSSLFSLKSADLSGIDTSKMTTSQAGMATFYVAEYINQSGWVAKHNSLLISDAPTLVEWYPPEPQVSFNISKLYSLSDESLERIVQVLPQRTTATTITMGNQLIKRLTMAQIATITGKGWTIA